MQKTLRCGDIVPGCTFIAKGKTPEEAFRRASEHVRLEHRLRSVSPEVIAVIHGVISDDAPDDPGRSNRRDRSFPE